MVYHHLTPTCGFEKRRERTERREGGVRATKWSERGNERDGERGRWPGERGRKKVRKGGGRDKLKEQGERFSIPPLTALRLSLAVLIHGFSGL